MGLSAYPRTVKLAPARPTATARQVLGARPADARRVRPCSTACCRRSAYRETVARGVFRWGSARATPSALPGRFVTQDWLVRQAVPRRTAVSATCATRLPAAPPRTWIAVSLAAKTAASAPPRATGPTARAGAAAGRARARRPMPVSRSEDRLELVSEK